MDEGFESCRGCRFWVPAARAGGDDPGGRVGSCRRHPPPGLPPAGAELSEWPRTAHDHWCGEWSARSRGSGALPDWPTFMARLSMRTRNALLSGCNRYNPVEGWADLLAADGHHLLGRRNFRYGSLLELIESVSTLGLEVPSAWLNALPKWVVRDGRHPLPHRATEPRADSPGR